MRDAFDDLIRSVEKSPTYWTQVALLEFLQSLAAMRASRGVLSNKDLAKRVGVSPPTLSRWLNGNENMTISSMCRLATALGAAVHIHVADNKEKGRWKAEPGKWEEKQGDIQQRAPEPPPEAFPLTSDSRRHSVVYLADRRDTLRRDSQEADITMRSNEPIAEAANG